MVIENAVDWLWLRNRERGDFGMRIGGHRDMIVDISVNIDEAQRHRKALGFKPIQEIIQYYAEIGTPNEKNSYHWQWCWSTQASPS